MTINMEADSIVATSNTELCRAKQRGSVFILFADVNTYMDNWRTHGKNSGAPTGTAPTPLPIGVYE